MEDIFLAEAERSGDKKEIKKTFKPISSGSGLSSTPEKIPIPISTPKIFASVQNKGFSDELLTFSQHIKNMLNSNLDNEIEVRFWSYKNDKEITSISEILFNKIKSTLKNIEFISDKNGNAFKLFEIENTNDVIEISGNIRKKTSTLKDGSKLISYEEKIRDDKLTIKSQNYGYKITSTVEKILDFPEEKEPPNFNPTLKRERERTTFRISDISFGPQFYGYLIDVTKVTTKVKNNATSPIVTYELEIERDANVFRDTFRKNKSQEQHDKFYFNFINILKFILLLIQQVEREGELTPLKELESVRFKNPREIKLTKPLNFKINDFISDIKVKNNKKEVTGKINNDYAVSLKLDGERNILLMNSVGLYLFNKPFGLDESNVFKIGSIKPGKTENLTLLDVEIYKDNKIFLFDILLYDKTPFDQRYEKLGEILHSIHTKYDLFTGKMIYRKEFLFNAAPNAIYQNIKTLVAKSKEHYDLVYDGIIFNPVQLPYLNYNTLKWKPVELITIDFLVEKPENIQNEYNLMVGLPNKELTIFKGNENDPFDGKLIYDGPLNILSGVWEYKWDKTKKQFVPYRQRSDKPEPNFITIAQDNWNDIMEDLSIETLIGDDLKIMRKYHNIIKDQMLDENFDKGVQGPPSQGEGVTIMDWGSGRGGDIFKWNKLGLKEVIIVEPDLINLNELESRILTIKPTTKLSIIKNPDDQWLVGGQNTKLLEKSVKGKTLNGLVSFFSLTFFGRNREYYNDMLKTIDSILPVGSKFVGIVMDGRSVRKLLNRDKEAPEGKGKIFQSSAFSIQQTSKFIDVVAEDKNEILINISDKTSMVKSQTEWLFYFDLFRSQLENIGFKMIKTGVVNTGKQYQRLPLQSQIFSELNTSFVFERITLNKVENPIFNINNFIFKPMPMIKETNFFSTASLKSFVLYENPTFVEDLRKKMSDNAEIVFHGPLRECYENLARGLGKNKSALDYYKSHLLENDPKDLWIGQIINVLSQSLKYNIYVVDTNFNYIRSVTNNEFDISIIVMDVSLETSKRENKYILMVQEKDSKHFKDNTYKFEEYSEGQFNLPIDLSGNNKIIIKEQTSSIDDIESKFLQTLPPKYSMKDLEEIAKKGSTEKAKILKNKDYLTVFKDTSETGIINITKTLQYIPNLKVQVSYKGKPLKSFWEIWNANIEFQNEILNSSDPQEAIWELRDKYKYKIATTFSPVYARAIYEYFNAKIVLDPSAGWGDRMVGAFYAGVTEYIGFDPNRDLREGYIKIMELLGVSLKESTENSLIFSNNYKIYSLPFEVGYKELPKNYFDLVFTSPPFFDYEIYNPNNPTYKDWIKEFYTPLVVESVSALKPKGNLALYIGDTTSGKISDFMTKQITNLTPTKYLGKIGLQSFTKNILREVWIYNKK